MPAAVAIPIIAAAIGGGTAVGTAVYQNRQNNRRADEENARADTAAGRENDALMKAEEAAREQRDYDRWLTQATAEARQPYLNELAGLIGSGGGGGFRGADYTPGTYEAAQPFKAPDPRELLKDPGFQFEMEQGLQGVERSGISRGTFLTGGTGKALERYAAGLTATRGNEQYQRALGEYSLAESLRSSAFDRNEANKFNAAQLNQQGAYQSASLAQGSLGQRLNALSALAGMAAPTGAFPGSTPTTPRILPVPTPAPYENDIDRPRPPFTNPGFMQPEPPRRPGDSFMNPDDADQDSLALRRRAI